MESILQDLRYAARRLVRTPAFTLTAVLTLAIGIGAVTSVFSLVNGVLMRSLPFPAADRLMNVFAGGTAPLGLSRVIDGDKRSFDGAAALDRSPAVLSGMGPAEWIDANRVTASLFPLLGAQPYLGRLLRPDEDRPGSAPVVVVSYEFWSKRLGGDAAALGRMIRLDSLTYQVVGVTAPGFQYPAKAAMWCNLGPSISGPAGARRAGENGYWTIARLRPGVGLEQARRDLTAAVRNASAVYPTIRGDALSIEPLQGFLVGQVRTGLLILLGAVGLLLLTAATNVASLLVSRVVDRDREMSVRTALGARRARLASLVLTEATVLSVIGGAVGVVFATWGLRGLVTFLGADLPRIMDIHVSLPVLGFATAVSVGSGFLAGLIPALQAGRRDPVSGIRGYRDGGARRRRPGDFLVVAQVALTVVLLSGAGLLGRSFWRLIRLDPGFRADGVAVATLHLSEKQYGSAGPRAAYAAQALARAQALPGVTAAAVATGIPLSGGDIDFSLKVPGRATDRPAETWLAWVSPDYFQVLGIPLKRGTWATDPQAAVIDEAAARAYFPGENPLGRQVEANDGVARTIVGVVGDTRQESLNQDPPAHLYIPLGSSGPAYLKVIVRTSAAAAVVTPLREALEDLDPNAPLDRVEPMTAMMSTSLATEQAYATALGVFAFAALVLAAIGIYGLAANAVARRTREIGIRMALGADRSNVMVLVLSRGAVLTGLGLLVGMVGAAFGTRALKSLLFQVGAGDPVVLAAVAVVLFVATLAATYFPARRAASVDPLVALRTE